MERFTFWHLLCSGDFNFHLHFSLPFSSIIFSYFSNFPISIIIFFPCKISFKMRQLFLIGVLISVLGMALGQNQMPTKFLGSWSVDHSENFDEYLEAKGYGWFMRQVVKLASITKDFYKNQDGSYGCKIVTSKNSVEWPKFNLGEEFQAPYLDEAQHKILFTYDPADDALVEKHTKVDSPDEQPDVYKYIIDKDGWLVMHMEHNGVKTKRFYKKNN